MEHINSHPISDNEIAGYVENLYSSLFSEADGLPDDIKQLVRDSLLPSYARASLIAKSNQKTYRRAGFIVYSFSALAVGAVAIGTLFHSLSAWAFALELILLVLILLTIIHANQKRSHKNWLRARYIAERLRAAIFLTTCGVNPALLRLPANVSVTGKPDEAMLNDFNEIVAELPALQPCHGQPVENCVAFVRRSWLAEQRVFHLRVAKKAEERNVWLERLGIIVFSGAMLAAAMHLLFIRLHLPGLEQFLTFAAIFLPALGASIGGIRGHREYSRLAVRSHNMVLSLKALDRRFSSVTTPQEFSALLIQVEDLMLLELQDWLMLMSVAKLEAAA